MSKKEVTTKVSENHMAEKFDFKGKTDKELKEIAETLQNQVDKYRTMFIKAQGALEVILQMLPEGDDSEG